MTFPFLGIFIIFLAVFSYYRKKNTATQEQILNDFWAREEEANQTRRQDLSQLPYITIPVEKFPFGISSDPELLDYEADLKSLEQTKILNLNGQTNTDLKLKYGPANLTSLAEFDQNYVRLIRSLVAYAKCLIKNDFTKEAIPVLEFGVEIGSDIRANYTLLAKLYKNAQRTNDLDALFEKANALDSVMKKSILEQLNAIKEETSSDFSIL